MSLIALDLYTYLRADGACRLIGANMNLKAISKNMSQMIYANGKKRPRAQDQPVEISKLSWQFLSDNGFKVKKDICFKCVTKVDNSWVKKSNCPKVLKQLYMHGTYILL